MTVTHVGSTKKYSQSWDNIFQGKSAKSGKAGSKPAAAKKSAKAPKKAAKKATPKKGKKR
ncbi:MAG TPA: hypothetical protein VGJ26_06200 [Pirellulales bacterium]|jgi:hypothetical protein